MIDVSKLVAAQHPRGPELVDSTYHATNPVHEEFARNAEAVLTGPSTARVLNRHRVGGASKKVVLSEIPNEPEGVRYMVKPYHERAYVGTAAEAKRNPRQVSLPIQGWSEMVMQGLFNAAGYGHLYQQAHVVRHPQADLLVIRMPPDVHSLGKARSWDGGSQRWAPKIGGSTAGSDASRIAVMDFLADHDDRHEGNIVGDSRRMYVVDGGRAFDYGQGLLDDATLARLGLETPSITPAHFTLGSALRHFSSEDTDDRRVLREWWGRRGDVRKEFDRHLAAIRDPGIRGHLARNFEERAAFLDRAAASSDDLWRYDKVPIHTAETDHWRSAR